MVSQLNKNSPTRPTSNKYIKYAMFSRQISLQSTASGMMKFRGNMVARAWMTSVKSADHTYKSIYHIVAKHHTQSIVAKESATNEKIQWSHPLDFLFRSLRCSELLVTVSSWVAGCVCSGNITGPAPAQ